ncbi:microcin C transport system substrate-binding protein [Candidatus Electrothrix aarhusensis]|jgi:microcin C transport system substrate-binding protein|uniref:Microcin C transport system substrate-binding protein n=1 Tax=Candidatus Electrothrix aarhusensis TaxID=1859131 RepID=A0A444IY54_9BACT|nr:microcin C transport system substrate-binding protein [Candidatus Electrothrix aarhusensis]
MQIMCLSKNFFFAFVLCSAFLVHLSPNSVYAAHGVSLDGSLKYPAGFDHFDYVEPQANKGGLLTLHAIGSFDKMNPFTLKGTEAFGLFGIEQSLIFETLAVGSLDEPFAAYGLIAKDIELAADKKSVLFTLNEKARFSDGSPVTVEDVKFSLDTLKSDLAHPSYQIYYQDIIGAEIEDKAQGKIRFLFSRPNRELHIIASALPVLSKKFYTEHGFGADSKGDPMLPPVGSGPYIVKEVNPGKSITYERNPEYWATDHPTRKGTFNYKTITVKYFKDQIVSLEAFKAGEFDFMWVNIAKQWQRDLDGRPFDQGKLVKQTFPHKNNQGMQGFVFNTRKELFNNPKVRQALGLAFDFEWTNNALFFNQYTRANSYFSNSDLAATGLPGEAELKLLNLLKEKYPGAIPPEVFKSPITPPTTTPPNTLRGNLRQAQKLLTQQGWKVKDGVLVSADGKQRFEFEILLVSPSFERVMAPYVKNLEKLGIKASYRTIDAALYTDRLKNFDFDMTVTVFGQSQSPGNEQRDKWSSTAASHNGSSNLAGIQSPVVDSLVDSLIYAETQEELTAACKALDRVLWYGYYVVPNWYLAYHRLTFASKFKQPKQLPVYYNPYELLYTWWF